MANTGDKTQTYYRLRKVAKYLGDVDFCFTYGDGVGDNDITKLTDSHKKSQDGFNF